MRVSINVIDLDKTLIPYDSFRLLAIEEIKKLDLGIIYLTVLRISRLISLNLYKQNVFKILERKYDDHFFSIFAKKLYHDVDPRVLEIIQNSKNLGSTNILLSASPNLYVKHLIKELNWTGCGSYFSDSGVFVHLYGHQKVSYILENYSSNKFNYNLAISDSESDNDLLALFSEKVMWDPKI